MRQVALTLCVCVVSLLAASHVATASYYEGLNIPTFYSDSAATAPDTICTIGEYMEEEPSTVTKPSGVYYNSGVCLSCPPGYWCNGLTKKQCEPGLYTATWGEATCADCPIGHVCNEGVAVQCDDGTFSLTYNASLPGDCQSCVVDLAPEDEPPGVEFTYGGYLCVPEPEYWRDEEGYILPCRAEGVCCGGVDNDCCRNKYVGHDGVKYNEIVRAGYLCESCVDGFYAPNFDSMCEPCPRNPDLILFAVILGVFILCALAVRAARNSTQYFTTAIVAVNFFQVVAILGNFDYQWPAAVKALMNAFGFLLAEFSRYGLGCAAKGGISYTTMFGLRMASPIFILIMLVIIRIIIGVRNTVVECCCPVDTEGLTSAVDADIEVAKQAAKEQRKAEHIKTQRAVVNVYLAFLSVAYILLCVTMMEPWSCFQDPEKPNRYYLAASATMRCANHLRGPFGIGLDPRLRTIRWITIVFMFIYGLGIPAFIYYILRSHRETLHLEKTMARIGMLYKKYLRRRYYWEIFILARKLLVSLALFFTWQASVQILYLLIVFTVFLIAHLVYYPYVSREAGRLETVSLVFSIILLCMGWAFVKIGEARADGNSTDSAGTEEENDPLVMFLIVVVDGLIVFFGLLLIFFVVYELHRLYVKRTRGVLNGYATEDTRVYNHFFTSDLAVAATTDFNTTTDKAEGLLILTEGAEVGVSAGVAAAAVAAEPHNSGSREGSESESESASGSGLGSALESYVVERQLPMVAWFGLVENFPARLGDHDHDGDPSDPSKATSMLQYDYVDQSYQFDALFFEAGRYRLALYGGAAEPEIMFTCFKKDTYPPVCPERLMLTYELEVTEAKVVPSFYTFVNTAALRKLSGLVRSPMSAVIPLERTRFQFLLYNSAALHVAFTPLIDGLPTNDYVADVKKATTRHLLPRPPPNKSPHDKMILARAEERVTDVTREEYEWETSVEELGYYCVYAEYELQTSQSNALSSLVVKAAADEGVPYGTNTYLVRIAMYAAGFTESEGKDIRQFFKVAGIAPPKLGKGSGDRRSKALSTASDTSAYASGYASGYVSRGGAGVFDTEDGTAADPTLYESDAPPAFDTIGILPPGGPPPGEGADPPNEPPPPVLDGVAPPPGPPPPVDGDDDAVASARLLAATDDGSSGGSGAGTGEDGAIELDSIVVDPSLAESAGEPGPVRASTQLNPAFEGEYGSEFSSLPTGEEADAILYGSAAGGGDGGGGDVDAAGVAVGVSGGVDPAVGGGGDAALPPPPRPADEFAEPPMSAPPPVAVEDGVETDASLLLPAVEPSVSTVESSEVAAGGEGAVGGEPLAVDAVEVGLLEGVDGGNGEQSSSSVLGDSSSGELST